MSCTQTAAERWSRLHSSLHSGAAENTAGRPAHLQAVCCDVLAGGALLDTQRHQKLLGLGVAQELDLPKAGSERVSVVVKVVPCRAAACSRVRGRQQRACTHTSAQPQPRYLPP